MKPETFICPACVHDYPYMPDLAGMRIECPDCRYPFVIRPPRRTIRQRAALAAPAFAGGADAALNSDTDDILKLLPEDVSNGEEGETFPLAPCSMESYDAIVVPPAAPTFTDEDDRALVIRRARPSSPVPAPRVRSANHRMWTTQDLVCITMGLCVSLLSVQLLFSASIRAIFCFVMMIAGLATAGYVVLRPHIKLLMQI